MSKEVKLLKVTDYGNGVLRINGKEYFSRKAYTSQCRKRERAEESFKAIIKIARTTLIKLQKPKRRLKSSKGE